MSVLALYGWYLPRYWIDKTSFDVSTKVNRETIDLMSFNVRCVSRHDRFKKSWFYRAPFTVRIIAEQKPDVIAFQEVTTEHEKFFRKHLIGYDFFIGYRADNIRKEGMLIAFKSDRFEKKKEGKFWLSETPEKMSVSWGSSQTRVAAYVTLFDKVSGKTVTVIDAHLDHVSERARSEGMGVILEQAQKRGLGTSILMGDMNAGDDEKMYERATSRFADALKAAPVSYAGTGATYHEYGTLLDIPRIDYIFVDPEIKVDEYAVCDKTYDGVYPSDHFPIVAKVRW